MMRYLLILLVFVSCNPVKLVLKDPVKFEAVADEMIKRGYCLNDTIYKFKTDTLEVHDTTLVVDTLFEVRNDTAYFWETKFQTITKVRTIRDSIKSVVIDSGQVQVLRKQLAAANGFKDAAVKDMKGLRKILQIGAAAAAVFFLLLFKLK
jgi:hypothetical protein